MMMLMATQGSHTFWTGPEEDPYRYRIVSDSDYPTSDASGAEGMVFRATLSSGADVPGEVVALKILQKGAVEDFPMMRRRFVAMQGVEHTNLMVASEMFLGTALRPDADEAPGPGDFTVCCSVADWIEGRSLNEAVEAHEDFRRYALSSVATIARAVQYLHEVRTPDAPEGLAHRDLKPTNVMVDAAGTIKIIDYGSARPIGGDPASVAGTQSYMAPEVANLEPNIDLARADAYSVGAIACDLVLRYRPMVSGSAASEEAIATALGDDATLLAVDIAHHIAQLIQQDPAARPRDLAAWAATLEALLEGVPLPPEPVWVPPTRRGSLVAVAALAAVAVATTAAMLWPRSTDGDDRAGSTPTTVSTPTAPTTTWLCSTVPDLEPNDVSTKITTAFAELDACAGVPETLVDATILPLLTRTGQADGVLIASPETPALRLTGAQYSSYREIAGRSQPENAALYGGYPSQMREVDDPKVTVIDLTMGGVVVGRRPDTQSFWVPAQAMGLWNAHGGLTGDLGVPTSNVFFLADRLKLEFEHGYMEAIVRDSNPAAATWLPIDASTTDVHIVDDPGAALADAGDLRGRVLHQSGSTAWFVDEQGRRRWIADGATWECLRAADVRLPDEIPGYAVATLPMGPPARCDDAG